MAKIVKVTGTFSFNIVVPNDFGDNEKETSETATDIKLSLDGGEIENVLEDWDITVHDIDFSVQSTSIEDVEEEEASPSPSP